MKILMVLVIVILSLSLGVGAHASELYSGSSVQPLYCFIDATGYTSNISFYGGDWSHGSGTVAGNTTIVDGFILNTTGIMYGDGATLYYMYNNSLTGLEAAGRLNITFNTGHTSITVVRARFYIAGNTSNGMTVVRVMAGDSLVYYTVFNSTVNTSTSWMLLYLYGSNASISVEAYWLPYNNSGSGNVMVAVLVDNVVGMCYPATPEALVQYQVYATISNATITVPSIANATIDYVERDVDVTFNYTTRNATIPVILNMEPYYEGYNLTIVLDSNNNPIPYYTNGNSIVVLLPAVNQTIKLVYTRQGRPTSTNNMLAEPLYLELNDFGDTGGMGQASEWQHAGYGMTFSTGREPRTNSISLIMTQNNVATEAWGEYYRTNLRVPAGKYTVYASTRISYSYLGTQYDYYYAGFAYYNSSRDYYNYTELMSGTITSYDGLVTGSFTMPIPSDQEYYYVVAYYAYQGTTWLRWLVVVGRPNISFNVNLRGTTTVRQNTTVNLAGTYYILLPRFTTNITFQNYTRTLFYTQAQAGSSVSFTMRPRSEVRTVIVGIQGGVRYNSTVIVAPPYSNISMTVELTAPTIGILPFDPVLANTSIIYILSNSTGPIKNGTETTNSSGIAVFNIPGSSPGAYYVTVAPTVWPYTVPTSVTIYYDTVNVTYVNGTVTMSRNSTITVNFTARYNISGLPFTGNITFNATGNITLTNNTVAVLNGNGNITVNSENISGTYMVVAVNATAGGLTFNATGNLTVIVTGAHIIILVYPSGPPYYIYYNLTFKVYAVHDDGSPATGNGSIIVEKDHYLLRKIAWNGTPVTITIRAGHVNYLNATLQEQGTVYNVSNSTIIDGVPMTSGGTAGGVEFMSFTPESYYHAALLDGLLATIYIALAIAPYMLRNYTRIFNGELGRIIFVGLVLGLTIATLAGRTQIPVTAYVKQTSNGTTLVPVYKPNPFYKIYIAPLFIEVLALLNDIITLVLKIFNRVSRL